MSKRKPVVTKIDEAKEAINILEEKVDAHIKSLDKKIEEKVEVLIKKYFTTPSGNTI
jgi:hypothetical protein